MRKEVGKRGVDYTVWETNGALPDEMVAQRLAMIPIPTDHKMFHYEENMSDLQGFGSGRSRMSYL